MDEMITGADLKFFEIVDPKTALSKDHNAYYKYETKLPVQDHKTFSRLGGDFWKDNITFTKSTIPHPGRIIIKGFDPASKNGQQRNH